MVTYTINIMILDVVIEQDLGFFAFLTQFIAFY